MEQPLQPREVRAVPFERIARWISIALVLAYAVLWLRWLASGSRGS